MPCFWPRAKGVADVGTYPGVGARLSTRGMGSAVPFAVQHAFREGLGDALTLERVNRLLLPCGQADGAGHALHVVSMRSAYQVEHEAVGLAWILARSAPASASRGSATV